MRLLLSWLRDFVDVNAPAEDIADRLGLRGFEVAAVEPFEDDDVVIDFEVTANRPDCLSVIGLAREVATAYGQSIALPSRSIDARIPLEPLATGDSDQLTVSVDDLDLCPHYAAAVADVRVGPSPAWLARRLRAAGIRPISSIVDLTNYVLIELGQPMHAFDLEKLADRTIHVRRAAAGETITTLDGVARTLHPDMLVIADATRAQAVAGVMGGGSSEVSAGTTRVAFESAYFQPASIRRTAKRLNLKTEASSRFERGADIEAPLVALERLASLMGRIGVGQIVGPVVDIYPTRRRPAQLHLRRARMTALLGVTVPDRDVERILGDLGLVVTPAPDGWAVLAPTFRVDLAREVDLIEEVSRHYGFDRLPATFPVVTAPPPAPDPRIPRDGRVRSLLRAAGFDEAITFGFIEAKSAEAFAFANAPAPIGIANPLSAKFDTLRPSIVPGLVDAVAHNRRHGREDVRLFEIGTRFSAAGETRAVGLAWTGAAQPQHWSGALRPADFFDLKGVVEALCGALDVPVRAETARQPFLAPGQTAAIVCAAGAAEGRVLGHLGQLEPAVADGRGLPRQDRVFVAELDLDAMDAARLRPAEATRALPRHPFVVRDLSFLVSDRLSAAIIRGTIRTAGGTGPAPLAGVAFFDRYQGKGVPEGSVSVSVRLTFQADRTLTDAEVQQSVDAVMAALVREHHAVQR